MTNSVIGGAGFTPPTRSAQTLLRGIALPQFLAVLTLVISITAVLTVTWRVGSTAKNQPVPYSSYNQSRLL